MEPRNTDDTATAAADAGEVSADTPTLQALPLLFGERTRLRNALADVEALIAYHLDALERREGEA